MSSMQVKVVNRKGETLWEANGIDPSMTVDQFKKKFSKECEYAKKKGLSYARCRFTVEDPKGTALGDKCKTLYDYIQTPSVTLYFKDLGAQVSWRTVFLVEYGGPIIITLAFLIFRKQIYGRDPEMTLNQKLGVFMGLLHYIKRELETIFVHKFSSDTMPIFNIFKNSFHYWILYGVATMYFYLHPEYTPPKWANETVFYACTGLFCFFEFMNLMCHITLGNLRKPGTTTRGIPKGWGFGLVSCANYFWEACAWTVFMIQAQVLGGYVFLGFSVYQMLVWALKKHKRYRQEFPDYPKNRKAMFPFLL